MDLLSPGAILKQLSLGVAFGPDALHLSLLSSHWERVRRVDAETIDGFQAMPPDRRRRRVQAFLERNRAAHCSVVVSLPRREVLLRQLELPLEARENLAKVVEYQRVHLLPSEEQAVATDTLAVREDSDPPRLRVTLFVVLQSTLDRTLDSCRQLGLSPDRILPGAVALADYLRASLPKAAAAPSLAVQLDPPRGELAGLVQGQLRLCKEFRYDSSNLEEVLESEAELFRGEAGLDEEAPLQLYLAGHGGPLSQSEGRLPFRALPPPAPSGPAHALAPPAAADWPALAAAFCGFKRKGALAVNLLPAALRPRKSRWEWVPTYALAALNLLLLLALLLQGPGAAAGLVPADEPGAGAPGAGGERLQKAGGRTGPLAGAGRPAGSPPPPQPTPPGRPGRAVTRPARRLGGDAADPAGGAAPHPGDLRPGRGPAQDPGGLPPFRAGGAGLLHQPELQGTGDLPPPGPTGGPGRAGGAFRPSLRRARFPPGGGPMTRLSGRERTLLVWGGLALALYLLLDLAVLPYWDSLGETRANAEFQARRVRNYRRMLQRQDRTRSELDQLQRRTQSLEQGLLDSPGDALAGAEIQGLVRDIAAAQGLTIRNSALAPVEPLGPHYSKVSTRINLSGGIHQWVDFVAAMGSGSRILFVEDLRIVPVRANDPKNKDIRVTLSVAALKRAEPKEDGKGPAAAAGPGPKGGAS